MTAERAFEVAAANMLAVGQSAYIGEIAKAVDMIVDAFRSGNKLLVFGNGGSAADSQHICAELVGRFARERRGLPAIALTSNQSVLSAWGNDYGFDTVFERQIQALGVPGDVAWGISTSGKSPNVLGAVKAARNAGIRTLGLTGYGGGLMAPYCDVLLAVPVKDTAQVQEVHVVTYHSICRQVEERIFGDGRDL